MYKCESNYAQLVYTSYQYIGPHHDAK